MTIQEKIKLLRKDRGLKQSQLAELCRVSDAAVGAWEQGERIPYLDNLISLADVFGVSLDVFRQDATSLDLPHPNESAESENNEPSYSGVPLRFGSTEPDERQSEILDFCSEFLNSLDNQFFVKGTGQNSEYGTGRYFWEQKTDLLMFIGFVPQFETDNPDFAFSVSVNTETPFSENTLAPFDCLQVTDNSEENWIYVPIRHEVKKENGEFSAELMEAAKNALISAMKIARLSLESTLQSFISSRNEIN